MTPCFAVEIVTSKSVLLHGLWFGSKRARRVVIVVHGLGSSLWKNLFFSLAKGLARGRTAVLIFNNRGHDRMSGLYRAGRSRSKRKWAGGASEVFTDCVDDIEGVIRFARKQGAKRVFLVGHSTGCQKSVYWAYKKKGRGVRGIVLLAPLSDYSVALRDDKNGRLARATKYARALVRQGKKHELLPQSIWPAIDDAHRFLSLYTPDSAEEMFTYAQPKKVPRIFRSVKLPTLTVFAGADEFGDRPAKDIAKWFTENNRSREFRTLIIPKVRHSFRGGERTVAREIRRFMQG